MANNLIELIFEQFIEIVIGLSRKSNCKLDECDFDYRVREFVGHRLIDVVYVDEDKCGRRRDIITQIDSTNICLEDLTTCRWVAYLEKLAKAFLCDICPIKLSIVKDEPRKCRPQPHKWQPFECKTVTTIIRKRKPVKKEPVCDIIIEKECECIPLCKREPCEPKHKVIIKYEAEKPWKCGDCEVLVEEPEERKHDFNWFKCNQDFNHHKWKGCCGDKHGNDDSNNKTFYESTSHH